MQAPINGAYPEVWPGEIILTLYFLEYFRVVWHSYIKQGNFATKFNKIYTHIHVFMFGTADDYKGLYIFSIVRSWIFQVFQKILRKDCMAQLSSKW